MLGFVSRLVGESTAASGSSGAADEGAGPPSTRIYECPDCESVYLAEDQTSCRSCETDVEAVPTEHDLGFGSATAGDD